MSPGLANIMIDLLTSIDDSIHLILLYLLGTIIVGCIRWLNKITAEPLK